MMRFLLFGACAVLLTLSSSKAESAGVEYVCGTTVLSGSHWAEAGTFKCEDPSGKTAKTEIGDSEGKSPVICMFQAQCTPATPALKQMILAQTGKKSWADLDDEQINQATIKAYAGASPDSFGMVPMTVHCIGEKRINPAATTLAKREQVRCPSVNKCVNDRNSLTAWKWKPLSNMNPATAEVSDSEGYRVEKAPGSAPRGVTQ